jgi:hypothetical protein
MYLHTSPVSFHIILSLLQPLWPSFDSLKEQTLLYIEAFKHILLFLPRTLFSSSQSPLNLCLGSIHPTVHFLREASQIQIMFFCYHLSSHSYFWQYWGLNLGPHTSYAGTLLLEPFCQSFFVLGIFEIGSHELLAWAGLKPLLS